MNTRTLPASRTQSRRMPIRLRAAQALLIGPLGLLVTATALGFSVFSSDSLSPLEWCVATWAVVGGAGAALAGLRLGTSRTPAVLIALNSIAFSVVKLIAYGESASLVFMALAVLTLWCLRNPAGAGGRAARFQVVGVDGRAWLLRWQAPGAWQVEAAYD